MTIDMTGIDPLPSGNFRARVWFGGKVAASKTCETVEEAVEFRVAVLQEIADGAVPIVGATLAQVGPRFLVSRSGNRNTKTDDGRWHMHIKPAAFAQKPLAALTRRDGEEWLETLKAKTTTYDPDKHGKRVAKPLSWQTRKHCLNLARRGIAYAIAKEHFAGPNPFADLTLEREDGDEDEGFQDDWYLDAKDQARLASVWSAIEWPEHEATRRPVEVLVVRFAMYTGLRLGELACLHLVDLHLEGDDPHVYVRFGSWDPVKERYRSPKGRKGERKPRKVPLWGPGLEVAKAWLAQLPTYAPENPLGLVFPTERGARRGKKPPRSWSRVVEKFGVVPRIGRTLWWHLLRHTCASSLLSGAWGMRWSTEDVQKILGHSDIRTTQRYAHLAPSAVSQAAARAHAAWSHRHATATAASSVRRNPEEDHRRATEDSNLRPTAPEAAEFSINAGENARRDGAVTVEAVVDVLRGIEAGDLVASRRVVDLLAQLLVELLAGKEARRVG